MNRLIALTITLLIILSSGCSTKHLNTEQKMSDKHRVLLSSIGEDSSGSSECSEGKSQSNILPSTEVKLILKDNRIIAKLHTDWNGSKQGDLKLHWTAPKGSQCVSTIFPIMKYKDRRDYSWAYRTVDHNAKGLAVNCSGLWKAEVMYNPTKQIVGEASLYIKNTDITQS